MPMLRTEASIAERASPMSGHATSPASPSTPSPRMSMPASLQPFDDGERSASRIFAGASAAPRRNEELAS
jgi:hypothetical protein